MSPSSARVGEECCSILELHCLPRNPTNAVRQRAALAADGMVTAGPVLGARGGEMQS
jgi:hypothetical protein